MKRLGLLKDNQRLIEHDLGLDLLALIDHFGVNSEVCLETIDEGKAWLKIGPKRSEVRTGCKQIMRNKSIHPSVLLAVELIALSVILILLLVRRFIVGF
jgi:hypothetical protein